MLLLTSLCKYQVMSSICPAQPTCTASCTAYQVPTSTAADLFTELPISLHADLQAPKKGSKSLVTYPHLTQHQFS
jgi:hypothetical protein